MVIFVIGVHRIWSISRPSIGETPILIHTDCEAALLGSHQSNSIRSVLRLAMPSDRILLLPAKLIEERNALVTFVSHLMTSIVGLVILGGSSVGRSEWSARPAPGVKSDTLAGHVVGLPPGHRGAMLRIDRRGHSDLADRIAVTITAGLDVGGAHLKLALVEDGRAIAVEQFVCPLWQGLDKLDAALVAAGLALVPERRRIFKDLSVAENLRLAATTVPKSLRSGRMEEMALLFPVLREKWDLSAGFLSGGQAQQLAVARALMSDPKLLLLDEPCLGLAPTMVDVIFELLNTLRDKGQTVLVVEQQAQRVLGIADRGYVLRTGEIVASGSGASLLANGDLFATYVGG